MSMFRGASKHACVRGELGQTFVEYALVLAAVVVAVLLTVTWTGLTDVMQSAMDAVAGAV
jgi:Flp pilus assembly pilin Flp